MIENEFKLSNDFFSQRTNDVICEELITFRQLNLSENITKGLLDNNYKHPSPIQFKSIPMGLLGLDLIIQAKSGTGKTCVFSVLSLETINISSKIPQVLILSPTREIAMQSKNVITSIGFYLDNLSVQLFIGGTKVTDDLKNLKNCQIAVGTPGRIKYLIEENHLQVDAIRLFVLDEADMLFADNFQNIINWIYNSLPIKKQMITLSATYTEDMIEIVVKYMKSPVMIRLNNNERASLVGIRHYYKEIESVPTTQQIFWSKTEILMDILSSIDFQQCIVFSNYQSVAQDLCDALESKGWSAAYISGNLDQNQRTDIYKKLKNFYCRVLVATDLISRGIDAENVNLIINLEVPMEFETYLHRMGRAGRFGSYGAVFNIVTKDEKNMLDNIKHICGISLEKLPDLIPCDILDGGCIRCVDDVTVEKIVDSNNINNIYKMFHLDQQRDYNKVFNQIEKVGTVDQLKNKLSFEFIVKMQNTFREKDIVEDLIIHGGQKDLFNHLIYKIVEEKCSLNLSTKNKVQSSVENVVVSENHICEFSPNKEELNILEMEYSRLYSWADYYSQEYQRLANQIKLKKEELNSVAVL